MIAPLISANLFQLSGSSLHITYSASGINGKPHFHYQDSQLNLNFEASQIRSVECDLGRLVSVSLRQTPDSGSTTFSVILPRVQLRSGETVQVRTDGIQTIHRFSIAPQLNHGQLDLYQVTTLRGTAQNVQFWLPDALALAADAASGELRDVLTEYARQERGHEAFVEQTLVRLGLRPDEVKQSVPLATTRLIDLLMREMFAATPCSALLLAAIVEADDFSEGELPALQQDFSRHHDAPPDCLAPFFQHSQIDSDLGHGQLAQKHASLLQFDDGTALHETVNRLHDLKHAFDAQKLEIKDYYSRQGNYFPRQRVDFFSI